jgi:DNA polymerase (family X)
MLWYHFKVSNQEIAQLFKNVAAAYLIKNSRKFYFQILAYQKASETIRTTTSEIKDLYKEKKLDTLPGIGITIRSRLEELFRKGSVAHFAAVFKNIPGSVFVLMNVPSIGPKKAYKLAKKLDLNNPKTIIDDVIIKAKNRQISKIPTFGAKSEQDILRALLEYKKGKGKTTRMVLPYAWELAEKIVAYLNQSPAISKAVPLGSLRRMAPTVGDVDIAIATDKPQEAIEHFIAYPYKERIIEKGSTTASILTSGGKQVDVMTQPASRFGTLLQHFTGSKEHNVHLREYALAKGLSLSEYGIKHKIKNGKRKISNYNTEESLYSALGMSWVPPEIREDKGEIELAIEDKLPNLVELSDIKGDLHIHSNFPIEPSHDLGQSSIKDMAEYAEKLSYEYIGFSEHNPSASMHTSNQVYSLIARRNELIEQIKLKIKNVRIIKLLEIDILASGKLAIDDRSMDLLDGAIVSIHSSFATNKKDMTKRVLAGLSHPKAKIFAHPTGKLINERPGYVLDFDLVFDFCKKNNKALEINCWPSRLDLPDSLIKTATENEVKLIINTDSHAACQMNLMRYGIAMARRGWAQKSDIVNTLGYNKFINWLKT